MVTREVMGRVREIQALDVAIESVERDLDRGGWSFSEALSLMSHLKKLRAMRSSLAESSAEDEPQRMKSR